MARFDPLTGKIVQQPAFAASVTAGNTTLTISPTTGAVIASLNLANANTWSGQQTFGTTAPKFSTTTQGSVYFAGANGVLTEDNQNFFWDDIANALNISNTLSSELLTNGSFTGNANNWTVPAGYAYSSNTVVHNSNGTGALSQAVAVYDGDVVILTYTISALTVGTIQPAIAGTNGTLVSANGTYTERIRCSTGSATLTFTPSNTARFTIDTISLKRLSGGSITAGASSFNDRQIISKANGNYSFGSTNHMDVVNPTGSYSNIGFKFGSTYRSGIQSTVSGGLNFFQTGDYGVGFFSGIGSGSPYSYNNSSTFYHSGIGYFNSYVCAGGGVRAGSTSAPTSTLQSDGSTAFKASLITSTNYTLASYETQVLCDATNSQGCVGTPTYGCNTYSNQTDCENKDYHGGCSWNSVYCPSYNGDQSSCTSYGCTWDSSNCNSFNGDYYNCTNTSGCSWTGNLDCSAFNADSATCGATMGCTWNGNSCGSYDEMTCNSNSPCYWSSSSCSDFNGNQSSCEMTSGCAWDTADCSAFDADSGTCSATSGCTWNSSNCSDFNGNQSSCEMTGGCAWDTADCVVFNGDYASCTGNGCSWSGGEIDCSTFNGTDEAVCTANSGCSWNSETSVCYGSCSGMYSPGTCSGSYNEFCSGMYSTGTCSGNYNTGCYGDNSYCSGSYDPQTCTGSYYPGTCSGSGGYCGGTANCGGIEDSGICATESGCSWSSQIDLYLPFGDGCPDRTYWIKNITPGGTDVVIHSQNGEDIDGSGTLTLSGYNDGTQLSFYRRSRDCSDFNGNQSSCESTSGCSWDGSYCTGTYYVRRWYEMSHRR